MAQSTIPNNTIKIKSFNFTNLAQYSPSGYYLYITGVKAKADIPSNATLINASISGWSGLGTTPNVQLSNDDQITVFFTSGTSITSSSRITVRFAYI
jgi:hypothetical protein